MRRSQAAGAAGLAVVLLVGGCTAHDPDMPGLTASPTTESTPTATPTPTPTSTQSKIAGTVVDLSDAELGIVFDDVPELSGDEADVHNWIATFEVEYWRTMTTNTVSPAMSVMASPEVQARMDRMAANNTASGLEVGGELSVTISRIAVSGDTAVGWVCDDFRGAAFADPSGEYTPEQMGADVPIAKDVSLVRGVGEGQWTVATLEDAGSC